jgi:hypothetical protein
MKLSKAIKQIQSGKLAIKNDKFSKFKKCIKYLFPEDDGKYFDIHGDPWVYAWAEDIDGCDWNASDETNLPTIKASKLWDKIRNELPDGHMGAVSMFNYMYEEFISTASNKVETPDNPCTWGSESEALCTLGSRPEQPKHKDFFTKKQREILSDFLYREINNLSKDALCDLIHLFSKGYVPYSYEYSWSEDMGARGEFLVKDKSGETVTIST